MQLVKEADLVELDVDDVRGLLLFHEEDMANEELRELEKQKTVEEAEDYDDTEEAPPTQCLTTAMLTPGRAKINKLQDIFSENDLDLEHSSAVKKAVLDGISSYQEILHDRKQQARQPTLDAH